MCPRRSARVLTLAAVAALASLPPAAHAAPFRWTGLATLGGTPNNLYGAFANWSPAGLPGAADDVTFASGFNSGTAIRLPGPYAVANFVVETDTPFSLENAFGDATYTLGLSYYHTGAAAVAFNVPVRLGSTTGMNPIFVSAGSLSLNAGVAPVAPSGVGKILKLGVGTLAVAGGYDRVSFDVSGGTLALASSSTAGTAATIGLGGDTTLSLNAPLTLHHPVVASATGASTLRVPRPHAVTVSSVSTGNSGVVVLEPAHPQSLLRISSLSPASSIGIDGPGTVELPDVAATVRVQGGRLRLPQGGTDLRVLLFTGTLDLQGITSLRELKVDVIPVTVAASGVNLISDPILANTPQNVTPIFKTGTGILRLGQHPANWGGTFDVREGTLDLTALTGPYNLPVRLAGGTAFARAATPPRFVSVSPTGGTLTLTAGTGSVATVAGTGTLVVRGDLFQPTVLTFPNAAAFTGPLVLGDAQALAPVTLSLPNGLPTPSAPPRQPLTVNPGSTLRAAGVVARPVSGAGTVVATAALTLGDDASPTGFALTGTLDTADAQVTLLSASPAIPLPNLTLVRTNGVLTSNRTLYLPQGRSLTAYPDSTLLAPLHARGTVSILPLPLELGTVLTGPLLVRAPFSGDATLSGPVEFFDTVSPDASDPAAPSTPAPIATLSADAVTLRSSATLVLEVASFDQYDRLAAAGPVALAGTLDLRLVNGYLPPDRFRFDLLTAASVSGTFSAVLLPPEFGPQWFIEYSPTRVSLTNVRVVPEPAALAALTPFLTLARRRSRRAATASH